MASAVLLCECQRRVRRVSGCFANGHGVATMPDMIHAIGLHTVLGISVLAALFVSTAGAVTDDSRSRADTHGIPLAEPEIRNAMAMFERAVP